MTFVFRSAPHSSTAGREGVDALLAASAYCEDICVIFMDEGVNQLLVGQDTTSSLMKDYAPMFKLFDLYDVEQVYVHDASLQAQGIQYAELIIDAETVTTEELKLKLSSTKKILTF